LISGWAGAYDGFSSNDPYHITPVNKTAESVRVDGVKVWLFNLDADPEERQNLASANLSVVRSMQKRLHELSDPKNGYRMPQTNLPHPRSLPLLHNGTWAPFLADDDDLVQVDEDEDENIIV